MKTLSIDIPVGGMICPACKDAVETALLHCTGVISAKVNYRKQSATIEYDPEITDKEKIYNCIDSSGYTAGKKSISTLSLDIICLIAAVLLAFILMALNLNPIPSADEGSGYPFIFLIGLLTSTHCLAMCGGIMLSQTSGDLEISQNSQRKRILLSTGLYNGGRVLSYTLLGAIFGAVGTIISYGAKTKSLIFTLAGLAVVLMGGQMLGLLPRLGLLSPRQNAPCSLPKKAQGKFNGKPLIIGLLTGLMPCAPLCAMWLYSMGTGSFIRGGLIMLVFSLGTVPLMFLLGSVNSFIPPKKMKYMVKLSAVLVIALGLKMLIKGILISGVM